MGQRLTCKEFIAFLDDYLTGDQQPDVRAEFEWHLSVCPPCRDYLKTYDATVQLTESLGSQNGPAAGTSEQVPEEVPSELIAAILAARSKKS